MTSQALTAPSRRGRTALERQTRYLSQSIRLSEAESPGILRATIVALSLTVFAFLVWAGAAHVNEIARSSGEIIPAGQTRMVQHRDGGIIKEILVRDGMRVQKGQALLKLDDAELRQDLARATARQTTLRLQEERLRALIDGRAPAFAAAGDNAADLIADQQAYLDSQRKSEQSDLAVIDEQMAQKQKSLQALRSELAGLAQNERLMADLMQKRTALNREGVLSDVRLLETRQRYNDLRGNVISVQGDIASTEASLAELQGRKTALTSGRRDDAHAELTRVQAEAAENDELIDKLQTRLERLLVTADTAGTIQGLQTQLRGSVIQPGQPIMEIVPDDAPLVVSLKILPRDIGHIGVGQKVQVKVSSFDFSRYGAVTGQLTALSPTTFQGENGERYYEGTVALDHDYVGPHKNRIQPGMTVMADIITGDKTILAYLLKPLQSAMSNAFSER